MAHDGRRRLISAHVCLNVEAIIDCQAAPTHKTQHCTAEQARQVHNIILRAAGKFARLPVRAM